jgi:hypothetical protein
MTGGRCKVPPKSNGQPHAATLDRKQKAGKSLASARFETGDDHFRVSVAVSNGLAGSYVAPHTNTLKKKPEAAERYGMAGRHSPRSFVVKPLGIAGATFKNSHVIPGAWSPNCGTGSLVLESFAPG